MKTDDQVKTSITTMPASVHSVATLRTTAIRLIYAAINIDVRVQRSLWTDTENSPYVSTD